MMDKRNLKVPIGHQLPDLGLGREAQVQRAIAMEMQAISRELFVRAATQFLTGDEHVGSDVFRLLAKDCATAARAYFEGLGVIQPEKPLDDSSQENT